MTEWYYSDAQRTQHGPVSAADLAALHTKGQLPAETLVWREGMSEWKPWREMIREVIAGDAPGDARAEALVKAAEAAPDDGAYRPYAVAEPSPYAPPQARVEEARAVVHGGRVVYAGFWKRVAASFIDSFVTTALSYIVQIPLMMIFGVSMVGMAGGDDPFASGAGIAMIGLIYVVSIGIPLLYFSWMHSSTHQASLGKMAVGIKVVRSNGERISFWRAFGRYWGMVLSALILLIGYLMAGFTERKQALHDMISDTLVVDKHAYTDHPEWQREELGTVTIVILALAGLAVFGMIALIAAMGVMLAGSGIR
ncbi:MAG: RDD family protein [Xanthomonadales bacterium]|nr:RDD family protein [Xanthomonadales bacterium]